MKNTLFITILLFISCKDAIKKPSTTKVTNKDSVSNKTYSFSNVNDIKKEYAIVQRKLINKELDSVSFNYDCEKNGTSGEVTYFSEKNTLKVIKHSYGEYSHFGATEMYYIANNIPFFIFIEEGYWSFDGGTSDEPQTKDEITEHRIYLNNNKVIEYLEKKYEIKSRYKTNVNPDNISNKKINSNANKELTNFQLLLQNKTKRGNQDCLN